MAGHGSLLEELTLCLNSIKPGVEGKKVPERGNSETENKRRWDINQSLLSGEIMWVAGLTVNLPTHRIVPLEPLPLRMALK